MPDINVFCRATVPRITVLDDLESAINGEAVRWHIHSTDSLVDEVEIKFKDRKDKYFNASHVFKKRVTHGHVDIRGRAPHLSKAGTEENKYTVRTLDARGGTLNELDPLIINCRPD